MAQLELDGLHAMVSLTERRTVGLCPYCKHPVDDHGGISYGLPRGCLWGYKGGQMVKGSVAVNCGCTWVVGEP